MKGQIHLHTPYSDGEITIEDIINSKLDFVAITDHDTLEGNKPYISELTKHGIETIPGVEFTTYIYNSKHHLLIYYPEFQSEAINIFKEVKKQRRDRAHLIIEKMTNLGFTINDNILDDYTGTVSKGQMSRFFYDHPKNQNLLKENNINSNEELIKKYLIRNRPAFVDLVPLNIEEILKNVDGVKVLAHPGQKINMGEGKELFEYMLDNNFIDGIETRTRKHNEDENQYFSQIANKYNLFQTTSNDAHYPNQLLENNADEYQLNQIKSRRNLTKKVLIPI
ncbi:PHP domain-containing protein [Nanoarchaeota archaeon]